MESFFRKSFLCGFRPTSVAYQKEFWISWQKRRFQIFQKPSSPGFQSFLTHDTNLSNTSTLVLFHVQTWKAINKWSIGYLWGWSLVSYWISIAFWCCHDQAGPRLGIKIDGCKILSWTPFNGAMYHLSTFGNLIQRKPICLSYTGLLLKN